jgi:hypothetical protein
VTRKLLIILTNAVVSFTLAGIGFAGMALRDPLLGGGYEWSTLLWITGLVTLFFIPLEVCVIKPQRKFQSRGYRRG